MSEYRGMDCNLICDSEITIYGVTESDLQTLTSRQNDKKEFGIGLLAVGIPCLLNSIAYFNTVPKSWSMFSVNFMIGLVCSIIGIVLLKMWWGERNNYCTTIERIKSGTSRKLKFPSKS